MNIDYDTLDECGNQPIARQRPEKDAAYWAWAHPDGRYFVTLIDGVSYNCDVCTMEEVTEAELSDYFSKDDFGA